MKIDADIKQFGLDHNVPISKDETLEFLLQTIERENSKQILEIGTAIGYSAISMAQNTNCEHIDTLEIDSERYEIANINIAKNKVGQKISTHLIDAKEYLKTCKKTYDLVYLDGPKGQYINYLPDILRMLKKDGIIVADNLYFHGMVTGKIPVSKGCRAMIKGLKKYIQEITTNPALDTKIYDIGDGVGLTRKKTD